jgi:hypothetical protein
VFLRPVLALLTATVAVPAFGQLAGEPSIAPAEGGHLVPTRVEIPVGQLETDPGRCRLLPVDQQPERDPAGLADARRTAGVSGQVLTVYVPATTCNTPR